MEKSLEKCPDKNAKLTFNLSAYIREEIVEPDTISHKSYTSVNDIQNITQSAIQQPDFKKKKVETNDPLPSDTDSKAK